MTTTTTTKNTTTITTIPSRHPHYYDKDRKGLGSSPGLDRTEPRARSNSNKAWVLPSKPRANGQRRRSIMEIDRDAENKMLQVTDPPPPLFHHISPLVDRDVENKMIQVTDPPPPLSVTYIPSC